LHHFSEDADDAVLEVGEVGGEDAGGLGVVHFAVKASIYMLEMCVLGVANEVGWSDASWRKFASRVHVMSVSNPTSMLLAPPCGLDSCITGLIVGHVSHLSASLKASDLNFRTSQSPTRHHILRPPLHSSFSSGYPPARRTITPKAFPAPHPTAHQSRPKQASSSRLLPKAVMRLAKTSG
jgi:hypothetical protein